ncbi:protein KASH5 isoform 4-T8 [Liasis olivaceus]
MMDHTYHKTLENTAVVQLTAVLSAETVPWDSIGISSKNIIMNGGQYSEEHVLKCTFKACDPEETGQVSVFRIIEYLQEMTGQSYEDWRLQSLYKKLDPEERGLTVDFSTFYAVMKDWIADCRQEGEETADLTNSIKDLQHGNKQLAVQNIKLQRTIEAAEELNSRLSEEISELKGKLRGSQQTLEQAKVLANELEDLKVFSKSVEEENIKLHTQARQLEKEQQFLSVQVDNLQDENKKLLLEKESSKCKIKELFTKKAKMKFQLCEYENLISCKDAALNACLYLQKTKQAEELTITLDEYRMMVQELKLEVSRLQEHLCQSYQDLKMPPTNSLQNINGPIQAPAQPLYMEIEESRRQEISKECGLPSPLCGMLHSLVIHPVAEGSISSLAEELEHSKKGSDDTKALLPTSHSLSQLSLVTDGRLILKNQEHKQHQNHLPSEKGSMEESKQSLTNEHTGNSKTLELTLKNSDVWTNSSNTESQMVCFTFQEIMVFSSTEFSEEALQEHTFIPNDGELIPIVWKKTNSCSFEILLQRLFDVPLDYLLLHILQKLVLLGLLLVCVSLIAVFCLVILYNQYSVWIEPKGNFGPFLQLQYRHPPPI